AETLREAGAEPVPLALPAVRPDGGVALAREWVADAAQISCSRQRLDGLLLAAEAPEDQAGLALAALRTNLPSVAAPCGDPHLSAALAALGLLPLLGDPASAAAEVARRGGPRPGELVDDFSLVNALRAGLSLGGGPELLVHLSAVAREAGSAGFPQTLRVITPETPQLVEPDSGWFAQHGRPGLLALLGDALNDKATVSGRLREVLPDPVPESPRTARTRLMFVEARASGATALCRVDEGQDEVSGECRVHHSEKFAVRLVEGGFVEPPCLLVVGGCGPRGGPGLSRLERLSQILEEDGLAGSVPVITDGLPPRSGPGNWISLFSPEAASGGVIARLRDGDTLRISLPEGRIRTGVEAGEFRGREPHAFPDRADAGYAARYRRSALPALEGAGFG
ncbi:MAG: Dihydroxy-acid dehydratase, partial [uncultured Rubrobacteraceae bacterium]